jgi:YD repeat-containing protein
VLFRRNSLLPRPGLPVPRLRAGIATLRFHEPRRLVLAGLRASRARLTQLQPHRLHARAHRGESRRGVLRETSPWLGEQYTEYEYDRAGRKTQERNGTTVNEQAYDKAGNVVVWNTPRNHDVITQYDVMGPPVRGRDPAADGAVRQRRIDAAVRRVGEHDDRAADAGGGGVPAPERDAQLVLSDERVARRRQPGRAGVLDGQPGRRDA